MKKKLSWKRILGMTLIILFFTIVLAMISIPSLLRSRMSSNEAAFLGMLRESEMLSADIDDGPEMNTDEFDHISENDFKDVSQNPVSTFSIDVDTASYSILRRALSLGHAPPAQAVRIEEMINYFTYEYPPPTGPDPFSITTEVAACPWNGSNELLLVGLQGKQVDYRELSPANLVFLIDSSGSMRDSNKLPLLKKAFRLLLDNLSEKDRVAIVAYAGTAGLVLPSTPADAKLMIMDAVESLMAGGSTAGHAGIEMAYEIAAENFIEKGNNRVILATDGDFNVGVSSTGDLVSVIVIEEKRKSGIYLTICGFGMGNYKDGRMEQISNAGNGNYFYIDTLEEARKVFVRDMRATLFTIAKDVKIQIEFNPIRVKAYRLIGYENRIMAREDFNDDTKDAGELGAGHSVTALYEIVAAESSQEIRKGDELKYQETTLSDQAHLSDEIATIKFRYKRPESDESTLMEQPVSDDVLKERNTSDNFRFAAAVAGFGMLLRDSPHKGQITIKDVQNLAAGARSKDEDGLRSEFLDLLDRYQKVITP